MTATTTIDAEVIIRGRAVYDTHDRAWDVTDMEAVAVVINGVEVALTPEQRNLIDVTDYAEDLVSAAQDDAKQRKQDRADWLCHLRMEAAE